ncbi:hypothetical protein SDC9_190879 [bioreactor metagenome]|uniref:tRNA threonylcarbamoyladenosine biosynthesis protein TsaB n=1 Tax=bioreactor metagenome TaxID=1076179 RepID=A0A645HWT3_9ZZZZ
MDARRNEFYNALFTVSDSKGTLVRLTPDRAISADALFDELFATGKAVLLNGDGAKKLYNIFSNKCAQEGRNFTYKLAPEHLIYQNAATVALLGEKSMSEGNKLAPAMLSPVYLRESGAERTKKSNEIGVNEK